MHAVGTATVSSASGAFVNHAETCAMLSHYSRADEAADPVNHYRLTLSSS